MIDTGTSYPPPEGLNISLFKVFEKYNMKGMSDDNKVLGTIVVRNDVASTSQIQDWINAAKIQCVPGINSVNAIAAIAIRPICFIIVIDSALLNKKTL
ncbi:MAG: hypothetical protein WBZ36_12340 [Candidatus Nitrosopolaris sp.]